MNEWFLYAFIVYQGGTYQPIAETYPSENACWASAKVLIAEKYIDGKYYAQCLPIGKWVDEGRRIHSENGRSNSGDKRARLLHSNDNTTGP